MQGGCASPVVRWDTTSDVSVWFVATSVHRFHHDPRPFHGRDMSRPYEYQPHERPRIPRDTIPELSDPFVHGVPEFGPGMRKRSPTGCSCRCSFRFSWPFQPNHGRGMPSHVRAPPNVPRHGRTDAEVRPYVCCGDWCVVWYAGREDSRFHGRL